MAGAGVFHRHIQTGLGTSHLLGGQGDDRHIQHPVHRRPAAPFRADPRPVRNFHSRKPDFGQRTGLVHGRDFGGVRPRGVGRYDENGYPLRRMVGGGGAAHRQQVVGDVAVHHVGFGTVQSPAVPVANGGHLHPGGVPFAARLGKGQGPQAFPGGDAGQMGGFLLFGTGLHEQSRRQDHRGQVGGGHQDPPHFLHQHRRLHRGGPRPPVLFGNGHGLPAHFGDGRPRLRVVSGLGFHQGAGGIQPGPLLQEPAGGVAQHLLFFGQGQPQTGLLGSFRLMITQRRGGSSVRRAAGA